MPAYSKRTSVAVGVGIILTAGAFLVVRFASSPAPAPAPELKQDVTGKPPTRQYLRLPGAVSQLPEWLEAEAPFDAREFFRHIPDDENAAPLYLEGLVEFGPELINLFPEDQRESLRQRCRPRPQNLNRLHQAWETNRAAISVDELDQFLKEYELGFQKLIDAQKRPRCVFESGYSIVSLIPHVQTVRTVARVVGLQSARDLERGEYARPLQLLEMLLRLNRDLRYRTTQIGQLVALASDAIAYKTVKEILDSPHCTTKHCVSCLELLVRHETEMPDASGAVIRTEYLMLRSIMRDIELRSGDFSPEAVTRLANEYGVSGNRASIGTLIEKLFENANTQRATQIDAQLELLTAGDYNREAETLKDFFRELLEADQQPFPEAQRQLTRIENAAASSLSINLLRGGTFHTYETILAADANSAALLGGTQCLVALRRWQLDGKPLPTDLAAVCSAAGMNAVPIDPYSGSELKMRKHAGQPVIYSIGPDLTDDAGRLESSGGLSASAAGDLLFRLAIPFE